MTYAWLVPHLQIECRLIHKKQLLFDQGWLINVKPLANSDGFMWKGVLLIIWSCMIGYKVNNDYNNRHTLTWNRSFIIILSTSHCKSVQDIMTLAISLYKNLYKGARSLIVGWNGSEQEQHEHSVHEIMNTGSWWIWNDIQSADALGNLIQQKNVKFAKVSKESFKRLTNASSANQECHDPGNQGNIASQDVLHGRIIHMHKMAHFDGFWFLHLCTFCRTMSM